MRPEQKIDYTKSNIPWEQGITLATFQGWLKSSVIFRHPHIIYSRKDNVQCQQNDIKGAADITSLYFTFAIHQRITIILIGQN